MTSGYYRFPTIQQENVVFVSEDDLWSVPATGGVARRLTSNLGEVTYPMLSPDGELLAFVGREEGASEVYVMPAAGGSARRLTYLSSFLRVVGWMPDSKQIIFTSSYGQPTASEMVLFTVAAQSSNGAVTQLPYGAARAISFGPGNRAVIGRNIGDPPRWKRYRGGTAGHLWIDADGDGNFSRYLPDLKGNIASPMWLVKGDSDLGRVYFVSDHEGVGNLYSAAPDGSDLQRHSDHEDYYVRNPHSDGKRIVYHAGADLFVHDVSRESTTRVDVSYHSPRVQRNRKFVDAARYLDAYSLHPSGQALAVTTRGKSYTFYNHEGPVVQYGKRDGVRYRHPTWLHDGRRMLMVSDEPGEETMEIYSGQPNKAPERLEGLEIGRVVMIKASPFEDKIALANHRYELLLVDLTTRTVEAIDRSAYTSISGFDWSPDGLWIAYSYAPSSRTSEIRLYQLPEAEPKSAKGKGKKDRSGDISASAEEEKATNPDADAPIVSTGEPPIVYAVGTQPLTTRGQRHIITRPVLHDVRPAFDPAGKYLYFLSYREFNPVYDGLHFDLGFPWGMRPYLITLRANLPNPFIPVPDLTGDDEDEEEEGEGDQESEEGEAESDEEEEGDDEGDDDGAEGEDNDDDDEGEEEDRDVEEGVEEEEAGDVDEEGDDEESARWSRRVTASRPLKRVPAQRAAKWEGDAAKKPAKDETSKGEKESADKKAADKKAADKKATDKKAKESKRKPIKIDLDGIERRILAFPVADGRYGQIIGIPNKALFTSYPIQGQLDRGYDREDEGDESGALRAYDFKEYKSETLAENVISFEVSANLKKLVYWARGQLRVIGAGEKAAGGSGTTRKTGWIGLGRIKVSVLPQSEWEQMFREAWRLQRDHFWTEDMSEVDWQIVYHRYFALIPRVSTRGEFSDLMWEMQGELGTSHAYEFGGDYRARPYYGQGFLGAQVSWDGEAGGYRVGEFILGDPWDASTNSPLAAPGVDIIPGDIIVAINGQKADTQTSPAQLLVNQAGLEVLLTLLARPKAATNGNGKGADDKKAKEKEDVDKEAEEKTVTDMILQDIHPEEESLSEGAKPEEKDEATEIESIIPDAAPPMGGNEGSSNLRAVVVKTIGSESPARYRTWVNENRRKVHEATDGRVGYIHIPDMGAEGYAEFHRGYLAEVDRDALVIDVRYNGGGHVSQLLLEKLARRRLGYDLSRWGGMTPYPVESVSGPLVALTNEHAGSDGDIFCHSFKMLKLGPLVGKRTWGGVIGISPRHALVDGTVTTQPEYSHWFEDVGWEVENYGTDPDIEVDITPQDYRDGNDPQLARAIQEAVQLLAGEARKLPELKTKPSRGLPKLPPRVPPPPSTSA